MTTTTTNRTYESLKRIERLENTLEALKENKAWAERYGYDNKVEVLEDRIAEIQDEILLIKESL